MFDNNGGNKVYSFSLPIDKVIIPFWDMLRALKMFEAGYSILKFDGDIFAKNVAEIENKRKNAIEECPTQEDVQAVKDVYDGKVFEQVVSYIKQKLDVSALVPQYLSKSTYFLIYQQGNIIAVSYGRSAVEFEDDFRKVWNKLPIVRTLLELVKDEFKAESFIEGIEKNYNWSLTRGITENAIDILSPIYPISVLDEDKIVEKSLDSDDSFVWLNRKLYKTLQFEVSDGAETFSWIEAKESPWGKLTTGIKYGKFFIPIGFDYANLLNEQNRLLYYKTNFQTNVYHRIEKDNSFKYSPTKLVTEFKKDVEKSNFTSILSYLKHNLYIDKAILSEDSPLQKYFCDVVALSQLNQLENFSFYVADAKKSLFSVYKTDKAGIDSLNLLHSISSDENKVSCWRGESNVRRIPKNIVSILSPDVAFYYVRLFFEEFVQKALAELSDSYSFSYVANQKVSYVNGENEIDIIALADKIYFIELKTNLSMDYVTAYKEKCMRWLDLCPEIADSMEFVIIGFLGKDDLLSQNSSAVKRKGMNTRTYSFKIKLKNQKYLNCFTESSYSLLKKKFKKLLNLNA